VYVLQVVARDADSADNGAVRYRLRAGPSSHLFHIDPVTGLLATARRLDRERAATHLVSVVARDAGVPATSASAIVRVAVRDVNDNPPAFLFPSPDNDTVHVSPAAPPGYVVTHLDAVDPDLGNNARVAYAAATAADDDDDDAAVPFSVDRRTGAVTVVDRLTDGQTFDVAVTATDAGGLAATSVLRLVVNSSSTHGLPVPAAPSPPPRRGSGRVPSVRLMIVVGVVVGCALLATCLIAAIVLVRAQRSSKRERHHYNCRTAACVRLQQTGSPAWAGTATAAGAAGPPPLAVEVYTGPAAKSPPLWSPPTLDGTSGSLVYNGTWTAGGCRYQASPCARSPSVDCASLGCLRCNHAQV